MFVECECDIHYQHHHSTIVEPHSRGEGEDVQYLSIYVQNQKIKKKEKFEIPINTLS